MRLLKPDAIEAVKTQLFPSALLVTPNIHEAQQLSGIGDQFTCRGTPRRQSHSWLRLQARVDQGRAFDRRTCHRSAL